MKDYIEDLVKSLLVVGVAFGIFFCVFLWLNSFFNENSSDDTLYFDKVEKCQELKELIK